VQGVQIPRGQVAAYGVLLPPQHRHVQVVMRCGSAEVQIQRTTAGHPPRRIQGEEQRVGRHRVESEPLASGIGRHLSILARTSSRGGRGPRLGLVHGVSKRRGSGLKVSEIAYGNWVTHGGQVGDDAARACVRAAWESGITFFDTADAYEAGAAETVLGAALKDLAVDRSDLVIASKVYWPITDNPNDRGLSRKHVMESIDKSLRRLQTDYVDIYQAHRHDRLVPVAETLRAFEDIVRSGKALYVGVSEWDAEQIAEALHIADEMRFDRIISNQPQYSMLYRVIEAEIVPLARKEGLGQIVFSPLAQGVLTGKYKPGQPPPAQSRAAERGQWTKDLMKDDLLAAVQDLAPDRRRARASPWPTWLSPGCSTTTTWRPRSSAPPGPSRCSTTSRRRVSG
jgi:aryl-alcohol dehydrogenase-like predicted oxidoreductase